MGGLHLRGTDAARPSSRYAFHSCLRIFHKGWRHFLPNTVPETGKPTMMPGRALHLADRTAGPSPARDGPGSLSPKTPPFPPHREPTFFNGPECQPDSRTGRAMAGPGAGRRRMAAHRLAGRHRLGPDLDHHGRRHAQRRAIRTPAAQCAGNGAGRGAGHHGVAPGQFPQPQRLLGLRHHELHPAGRGAGHRLALLAADRLADEGAAPQHGRQRGTAPGTGIRLRQRRPVAICGGEVPVLHPAVAGLDGAAHRCL